MNIEKLQNTNPADVAKRLMQNSIKLAFLMEDLRTFADAVGTNDYDELNKYHWFQQHVDGKGFEPSKALKKKLGITKVRKGNNNTSTALGSNVRMDIQDRALGLGKTDGNWGADAFSQRVAEHLESVGRPLCTTQQDFSKKAKVPFRCEHVVEVKQLTRDLVDLILNTNIDIRGLLEWIVKHSLVTTVTAEEDRASGTQKKNKVVHAMPFHRYSAADTQILMWTGDEIVDATSFTTEDIASIRSANPYYNNLYEAINQIKSPSAQEVERARSQFYGFRKSNKGTGVSSSSIPEMTDDNLAAFIRNDEEELIERFYPWKVKKSGEYVVLPAENAKVAA
jgi:hypothetical protein